MLIVLPPSETKAPHGTHPPLRLEELSFPSLQPIREQLCRDLAALDPEDALEVLGISKRLIAEAEANRQLTSAPTMPALLRYTGVLYDALDAATLPEEAWDSLAIGSALFGVVRARDCIPQYRLSGSVKLPTANGEKPTMKKRWGKAITEALEHSGSTILDLRSGTYQQLGKVSAATTVRVEALQPDGSRKVVSHFNKHYKGLLARDLAVALAKPGATESGTAGTGGNAPGSTETLGELAASAGWKVEQHAPTELTIVVDPQRF